MTTDGGLLFGLDDPEFVDGYPELAPLVPVAVAVRMMNEAGPFADRVQQASRWLDVVGDMKDAEPGREPEWIDYAALRHYDWAKQLRACVARLEEYGFHVDRHTGDITFPNGRPGPNPSLRTVAAGMILDGMDLQRTDPITNRVGEAVAKRLRGALSFGMLNDYDNRITGREESFKKTLRTHLVDPSRYRLAVRLPGA